MLKPIHMSTIHHSFLDPGDYLAILQDTSLWIRGVAKHTSSAPRLACHLPADALPHQRRLAWSQHSELVAVSLPKRRVVLVFAVTGELLYQPAVPGLDDAQPVCARVCSISVAGLAYI